MNKDDEITITSNDVKSDTVYTVDYNILNGANGVSHSAWWDAGSTQSTIDISKASTDITVAGKSLKKFMDSVEERLAILELNEKLEAEWAELKELGEQYRAKEREIKEKARAWNMLKKRNNT